MTTEPSQARHGAISGQTIVLIGMMGVGKSSVGRRLAASLGLPFLDADAEIEKAANATIEEIFTTHGEAFFREGERRVIARLLAGPPHVLATGGGAFLDPETRASIQAQGVSIWLKATLDLLTARVRRRTNRPLLKKGDPHDILAKLMTERYPIYEQADLTIEVQEEPIEITVDRVAATLADYQKTTSQSKKTPA